MTYTAVRQSRRISRHASMSWDATSLLQTKAAEDDRKYASWLSDFGDVSERLSGTNALTDMRLHRLAYRWFLDGLTPYEATVQRQGCRLPALPNQTPDTCLGCNTPESTVGGRWCSRCREE